MDDPALRSVTTTTQLSQVTKLLHIDVQEKQTIYRLCKERRASDYCEIKFTYLLTYVSSQGLF